MSCFHPLPAFVDREIGGKPRVGYWAGEQGDKLELPCGHCVGCQMDRSRSWSIRMMHEAQLYDSNVFLTLDYAPEKLPKSLSLEYRDFQLFMKRLRKEVKGVSKSPVGTYPVRFFCAGEYGARYGRPHWHAILFNTWFKDSVQLHNGSYRSGQAERLWDCGQVVIGDVTPQSAAYVAGYTLNKVYGRRSEDFYEDVVNLATGEVSKRRPEFCTMSRAPGIGAWWFEKFGGDVFPQDAAIVEGRKYKVPGYYWRKFKAAADSGVVEGLAYDRLERARAVPLAESTERRRNDREMVARARLNFYSERKLG